MKKILALFISFSLCLCSLCCTATAENTDKLPLDYIQMLETLNVLGISLDTEASADSYNRSITRGEFVKHLLDLIKLTPADTAASFNDLSPSHAYYREIAAAYDMKLITADVKDNIRPNEPITYIEGCKAVITLLGYSHRAESIGNGELGYLTLAKQLKLIQFNADIKTELTFASAVQLLYNAMQTKTAYLLPTDTRLREGATILETCYALETAEGLVTANGYYALTGDKTDEGCLVINGVQYKTEEYIDADCVGLLVKFFYNEENKIVALEKEEFEKLAVAGEDVKSFSNNSYRYYKENGKTASVKIAQDAYVLLNYEPAPKKQAMLPNECGELILIDYNCDNTYDVVFVNNFSETVVSGINTESGVISGKSGKSIRYKQEENLLIYKDGEIVDISYISLGSSITVCTAGDEKTTVIYLSDKTTEGTITKLGKDTVYIRGREYAVSKGFDTNITLKTGSCGIFYLNYNDEVIYFVSQSDSLKFGYLMRAKMNRSGADDNALFKLLTAENEKLVYYGKEKIEFNGSLLKASAVVSELEASGNTTSDNEATEEQLIRYGVTEGGLIYYIETALANDNSLSVNDERLYISASMTEGKKGFEATTAVSDKTVQFSVPQYARSSDKLYKAVNSVKEDKTNFKAYNLKRYSITADAVVGYTPGGGTLSGSGGGPAGKIDYDSHTAIITDIEKTLNPDGFEAKRVTLLQNVGWPIKIEELSYIVADNSAWETGDGSQEITSKGDNLNVGDVVLYSLNSSGEIGRINRVYNGEEKAIDSEYNGENPVTNNDGSFISPLRLLESYAYKTDGTYIMVSKVPITSQEPDRSLMEIHDYAYENVIIVERVKNDIKMRIGKITDIRTYESFGDECDKVLINTNWGVVRTVIAIRYDV